jgi:phosphoglycerol transferase
VQTLNVLGVKPAIMQDEMIYAKFSRLVPMSDAPIPDYIFYWIFSSTKACGPNFYSCGKAINLLAFVALAGVIFLIAKKAGGKVSAWIATVATLFSPIGYYTSFFMPDMLFFLSIAILSFCILSLDENSKTKYWVLLGAGLGIAALIKPHALFFGAVIAIYAIYLEKRKTSFKVKNVVIKVAAAAVASVIAKFTIGFIFAGINGLSLFGTSYTGAITSIGSQASNGVQVQRPTFWESLTTFISQLWGHSLATSLLFAAAGVVALFLASQKSFNETNRKSKDLAVLVLISLAVAIVTIGLFTTVITANGSDHSSRLMVRYYDYLVPLFYVLIALSANVALIAKIHMRVKIMAAIVFAASLLAQLTHLEPFKPAFYDGTSLVATASGGWLNWLIIGLAISLILAISLKNILSQTIASLTLLGCLSAGLFVVGQGAINPLREPDRFDFAADFIKGYLTDEEIDALTVVSHEDYALARSLLLIDNAKVDYRVLLRGQTLGSKSLAEGKEWVLLMGDTFLDSDGCMRQQGNGYILIKLCNSPEHYFNQTIPNSVVQSSSGISKPENWGSWTIGNKAVITLAKPLPRNAKVQFTLAVPKALEDQTFTATVGGSSIEFNLSTEVIDGTFDFENQSPSREIILTIPNPKSQKADGSSQDDRAVGLMLYKLKVLN